MFQFPLTSSSCWTQKQLNYFLLFTINISLYIKYKLLHLVKYFGLSTSSPKKLRFRKWLVPADLSQHKFQSAAPLKKWWYCRSREINMYCSKHPHIKYHSIKLNFELIMLRSYLKSSFLHFFDFLCFWAKYFCPLLLNAIFELWNS